MTVNPCRGIKVEKFGKRKPPRILSIAELVHLLRLTQQEVQTPLMAGKGKPSIVTVHPGDLIPYLVVGLWAGVRPEESVRMKWQHIDFKRKHIDLPAEITKDHQRRIIPMEPVLIEWLMPYRPANGQGKIVINWKLKFRAFTKAARFNPWPLDDRVSLSATVGVDIGPARGTSCQSASGGDSRKERRDGAMSDGQVEVTHLTSVQLLDAAIRREIGTEEPQPATRPGMEQSL